MIKHIGSFINKSVVCAVYSFNNGFQSFFTNFLSHSVQTITKKRSGVGAFRHFFMTFLNEILKFGKEEQRIRLIFFSPAGISTFVTSRSFGMNANEQRVIVAIVLDAYQM